MTKGKLKTARNKEVDTLCLLFDTRKNDAQNVRRARILPLVNEALKKIKLEKNYTLVTNCGNRYTRVEPEVGLVVATNELWQCGQHFSWSFYEIVNITDQGNIMVLEREKLPIKGESDV